MLYDTCVRQRDTAADAVTATNGISRVPSGTIGAAIRRCILPFVLVSGWIFLSSLLEWGIGITALGGGVLAVSACLIHRHVRSQKGP